MGMSHAYSRPALQPVSVSGRRGPRGQVHAGSLLGARATCERDAHSSTVSKRGSGSAEEKPTSEKISLLFHTKESGLRKGRVRLDVRRQKSPRLRSQVGGPVTRGVHAMACFDRTGQNVMQSPPVAVRPLQRLC